MGFPEHVWSQLKNLTKGDLCKALERDGWRCDMDGGSAHIYYKPGPPSLRVSVHYHKSSETMGRKLLMSLLSDACWSEQDMRRLRLIK